MARKETELESIIIEHYGIMLNLAQATKALGFHDRKAAENFLDGIPYYKTERQRKYLARDIAKRLASTIVNE